MKKALLILGLLGAVALARPAPADAHFSLSLGLPGFGLFIAEPGPPPVAYAPPVYYGYAPPLAFYGYRHPYHSYYGPRRGYYGYGRHGYRGYRRY